MRSVALSAVLSIAVCKNALGAPPPNPVNLTLDEELSAAARRSVDDYRLFYRTYTDRGERLVGPTLLSAAAHSGKPVGLLVTFYRLFQQTTRQTSAQSSAFLAWAAASTQRPPAEIASLYDDHSYGYEEASRLELKAILASIAAISGKSPRDVMKFAEEVGELRALDPEAGARLASGAAFSGKSVDDLIDLHRTIYDPKTPWYSRENAAIFASAAAISGLSGTEILAINEEIQAAESQGLSGHNSAELTFAAAVGLKRAWENFRPNLRRELTQPVERVPLGQSETAEKIFDLNWHSGLRP